ncbi:NAAT family transporter [bacterium]|jgi:multiple antibiotic resistance protein|nr:NAAT family transporter [bacterium]
MTLTAFTLFALSSLFAVIDPLGCIPFFSGQTSGMDRKEKQHVLIKSILVSFAVLLAFTFTGQYIMHLFGITVDAFRVAGGFIFFGIGLDMLQSKPRRWRTGLNKAFKEDQENEDLDDEDNDPSVTPLAIPMIAGPGSITTVMVLQAEATSLTFTLFIVLALIAILLLTGIILWTADALLFKIGKTGMKIVEKLMGLLIAVIAVQLIMDGLRPYLVSIAN